MKTCYPWFGGKSRVASLIWEALGPVTNYVEPFAGSLAVTIANPHKKPIVETVNDIDCFIPNFWRAISNNPEEVAKYADYPILETDLHARHQWLLAQRTPEFLAKMNNDSEFYDAKIAGYWVWGLCASTGNNWLQPKGLKAMPSLSTANGIHGKKNDILTWFKQLQTRTKRIRVTCGDWKRVCTPGVTYKNGGHGKDGVTGVFLDPPYEMENRSKVYAHDNDVFKDVVAWAIENANQPKLRIVLCGYEGDHGIPSDWRTIEWATQGGYANLGQDKQGMVNAKKERIWCSPQCLKP